MLYSELGYGTQRVSRNSWKHRFNVTTKFGVSITAYIIKGGRGLPLFHRERVAMNCEEVKSEGNRMTKEINIPVVTVLILQRVS